MEYIVWILLAVVFALVLRALLLESPGMKIIKALPGAKHQIIFWHIRWVINIYSRKRKYDSNVYLLQLLSGVPVLHMKTGFHAFRLGTECIVDVYSPDLMEKVLSSSVSIEKSFEYSFLHKWLGTGLLTSKGDKWKTRRKLLTPCFHFRILEDFLPLFHEQSSVLVKKLQDEVDQESINITPLIILCTLDIVCETVMGVHIGAQEGENSEYVEAIHNLGESFNQRIVRPWLWPNRLFFLSSMGRKYNKDVDIVHKFTQKVIRNKKQIRSEEATRPVVDRNPLMERKRQALMDLLLDLHLEKQQLTEEDIREEVDTFMFEGHDTTAMGIIFALYFIGLYSSIQRKIHEELDAIFGSDKKRPATMEDIRDMKYLECVLKESQRLNPSVPMVGRKLIEDIEYNGYFIPKNITVHCNIYSLHRNPNVFPNPEIFDPDRFSAESIQTRHPYAYLPFSAGPRNCIGQKFAMLEEKVVISNILRNFTISSLDPRDICMQKIEFTLRPGVPVRICFSSRT